MNWTHFYSSVSRSDINPEIGLNELKFFTTVHELIFSHQLLRKPHNKLHFIGEFEKKNSLWLNRIRTQDWRENKINLRKKILFFLNFSKLFHLCTTVFLHTFTHRTPSNKFQKQNYKREMKFDWNPSISCHSLHEFFFTATFIQLWSFNYNCSVYMSLFFFSLVKPSFFYSLPLNRIECKAKWKHLFAFMDEFGLSVWAVCGFVFV